MLDFDIQRCSRRCAATGRDLQPGDTYFSALVPEGGEVRRLDYSAEAWNGPPENCLGWWQAAVPAANQQRMQWAPNDVLLEYFEQLGEDAERRDLRYLLTLLLIRRRLLRLEGHEHNEQGEEIAVLYCPRNEQQYQVPVVMPENERLPLIQQELAQLLSAGGT